MPAAVLHNSQLPTDCIHSHTTPAPSTPLLIQHPEVKSCKDKSFSCSFFTIPLFINLLLPLWAAQEDRHALKSQFWWILIQCNFFFLFPEETCYTHSLFCDEASCKVFKNVTQLINSRDFKFFKMSYKSRTTTSYRVSDVFELFCFDCSGRLLSLALNKCIYY